MVDAGSGQDVLSKGLDAVKARVSLAKTGQHVAGSPGDPGIWPMGGVSPPRNCGSKVGANMARDRKNSWGE